MSKKRKLKNSAEGPRPKSRGLAGLEHSLRESVAVIPAQGASAPADLAARFSSVLAGLDGRTVGADALFEALKLESLDWGFDHGIETRILSTEEKPVPAETADEES